MRSVSTYGVEHVMKQFFAEHEPPKKPMYKYISTVGQENDEDDVLCDEELLAAFGD